MKKRMKHRSLRAGSLLVSCLFLALAVGWICADTLFGASLFGGLTGRGRDTVTVTVPELTGQLYSAALPDAPTLPARPFRRIRAIRPLRAAIRAALRTFRHLGHLRVQPRACPADSGAVAAARRAAEGDSRAAPRCSASYGLHGTACASCAGHGRSVAHRRRKSPARPRTVCRYPGVGAAFRPPQ